MKAAFFVFLALLTGVLPVAPGQAGGLHQTRPAARRSTPSLTAAQITGTYKAGEYGTLDVQALPTGKVRFRFEGLAHLHSPGGPNMGEAEGTLPLHRNTAVYTDKDDGGRMILRFGPRRVYVSQAGDLGFGTGVLAAGVYKKTSSRSPKFDPKGY